MSKSGSRIKHSRGFRSSLTRLTEVYEEHDGLSKPASFKSFYKTVTSGPTVHWVDQSADDQDGDWILIVGGPYEYLEECPTFGCLAWVIARSGKVIHKWEVDLDALWANGDHVSGLTVAKNFKPQHVELLADGNIVALFSNAFAIPYAVEDGDLLVSMRHLSTVALLDPARRKVKWLIAGLTLKQHSPRFLPDGSVVIFDNYGGDRSISGSRITRHRIFEDDFETIFPKQAAQGGVFETDYAGHITVHPDSDRLLASVSQLGTVWEISPRTGKEGWIYEKMFPAKNYPGAEDKADAYVRVEAFGAYYVDRQGFAAAMADASNN